MQPQGIRWESNSQPCDSSVEISQLKQSSKAIEHIKY